MVILPVYFSGRKYYEKKFLINCLAPGHSRTVDMGMWAGEECRGDARCVEKCSFGTCVR